MTQPTPTSPKPLEGPVHRVPCPWCGNPNDCRDLYKQMDTGAGFGSAFEKGTTFACDHCGNIVQVLRVEKVPIVQVKQHGQQIRAIAPRPKR